jgi:hypothetical protein
MAAANEEMGVLWSLCLWNRFLRLPGYFERPFQETYQGAIELGPIGRWIHDPNTYHGHVLPSQRSIRCR